LGMDILAISVVNRCLHHSCNKAIRRRVVDGTARDGGHGRADRRLPEHAHQPGERGQ